MRTLMLHGHGASASIFKAQTVAFRSKLDKSFTFDFIDGPFTSAPAPGLDAVFKSRNFTWFQNPDIKSVRATHRWLLEYIAANGPFDNVCCFSQGCSLIASLLLYHRRETPDEPLPFKSAVFICGGTNYSVLEDLGAPVSQRARTINEATGKLLKERAGALTFFASNLDQCQKGVGLWDDTDQLLHDSNVLPDRSDCFGLDFTSFPADVGITLPTLHLYGAKDPKWPASVQLSYLCENGTVYDHGGGHDIPRSTKVSEDIAGMFRELAKEIDA